MSHSECQLCVIEQPINVLFAQSVTDIVDKIDYMYQVMKIVLASLTSLMVSVPTFASPERDVTLIEYHLYIPGNLEVPHVIPHRCRECAIMYVIEQPRSVALLQLDPSPFICPVSQRHC